jgi:phenylacetate-CoA ligase
VLPRSSIPGVDWPPVPDGDGARSLALAYQLEQTQWWPAEKLRAHQELQLRRLLAHAATTTEHYAGRIDAGAPLDELPLLTRQAIIDAGPRLLSKRYPLQHGTAPETITSRSTGEPVRVRVPAIVTTFWNAITLRDHAWHRRDLTARLGAIRHTGAGAGEQAQAPAGARAAGWGPATADVAPDAPLSVLSVASTTAEQVAWLVREAPAYLLVYPTVLGAMCRLMAATGARVPALREVRTISEALSPDTRALCREVLGVPLVDTYSAQECGYIALQCPEHEHYHVMSERLLVEILDDDGRPCAPGAVGRVVVTDLHNFATPLVRYELGDYAEVGAPCPCGRGLPVLARVVGRRRGMLAHRDGRTVWPVFTVACREAAPYLECQLVQDAIDQLRLRVVPSPARPLEEHHRAALVAALHGALGAEFTVTVEVVDSIGRTPAGKLEEFVSHVLPRG